jgi:hypothetical protein
MSGKERIVAALLLAVAVAGAALVPRLLSAPAGPPGVALGAGPGPARSVVQAPALPQPPHPARSRSIVPQAAQVAPIVPVGYRPAAQPSAASQPAPVHRASPPPPSPPAPSPSPPSPSPPTPLPGPASQPASLPGPASLPAPSTPASTRPGHGYGDKNHVHTGPPGQPVPGSAGTEPPRRSHCHDLEGSGHGPQLPQAPPDGVGAHPHGVGHLPAPAAAAAPAANEAGSHARPEARGPCHQGRPAEPLTHAAGHGYGHRGWWGNQGGDG